MLVPEGSNGTERSFIVPSPADDQPSSQSGQEEAYYPNARRGGHREQTSLLSRLSRATNGASADGDVRRIITKTGGHLLRQIITLLQFGIELCLCSLVCGFYGTCSGVAYTL